MELYQPHEPFSSFLVDPYRNRCLFYSIDFFEQVQFFNLLNYPRSFGNMVLHHAWRAVELSLVLAPLVKADICSTLAQGGIDIEYPLTLDYSTELTKYWSAACGDLKPTCIAAPSSAAEMSQIIIELQNVETLFAIKSGGHMPNNGFASIANGLLISTKNLDQVFYNENDQTAIIGPGLSWEEAQNGLSGTGRAVVGGRLGGVGVGGYMLGCKSGLDVMGFHFDTFKVSNIH